MPQDLAKVYKVGALLLDCVCNVLAMTEGGCPERKSLVPGAEAEAVNCCSQGGQLSVSFQRAYPSRNFPVPSLGTPSNCDDPYNVVTYMVTVFRCMPVGDMEQAPSVDALDSAAFTTMVDTEAMRLGVFCCLTDRPAVESIVGAGYMWTFGDHIPYGPEGACAGSKLLVQVGIPTCWEC